MNKLNLICEPILNGIMAYWAEVEEAARYIVTLHVGDLAISTRDNERSERYCTFNGLAESSNYKVKVVAENRNGAIIAESEELKCRVTDLGNILNKIEDAIYACV